VGASLTDVFAAEHVLWVEGPTEAEIFRLLSFDASPRPPRLAILPLLHTADLQGQFAELVVEVYNRLSKGSALFTSDVVFYLIERTCPRRT
jgi:hypothetical protein